MSPHKDEINHSIVSEDLLSLGPGKFGTILADPPWRFDNRTGKMAPEHKRLSRYRTMPQQEIMGLPIQQMAQTKCHLYLWVPNTLILEGLEVMRRWGFKYKTNIVWYKIRKDGGPDGRGVGFYFRNVTELVLFGVRGSMRTLAPGRTQVNILSTCKREHSRKPDELYDIIERCSPGPYLELFARHSRPKWSQWGNQIGTDAINTDAINKPAHNAYSIRCSRCYHELPPGKRIWPRDHKSNEAAMKLEYNPDPEHLDWTLDNEIPITGKE